MHFSTNSIEGKPYFTRTILSYPAIPCEEYMSRVAAAYALKSDDFPHTSNKVIFEVFEYRRLKIINFTYLTLQSVFR